MNIDGIRRIKRPEPFMSVFSTRHNSSRRNFRRAKNALAYGAAALIGMYAASIGGASMFPANAQTITLETNCKTYKPGELGADMLCRVEQDRLATKENSKTTRENAIATREDGDATKQNNLAHQREQKLDADLSAQGRAKACIQEIALFKKRDPDGFNKLNLTPAAVAKNACDISKNLPRPTASAAPSGSTLTPVSRA